MKEMELLRGTVLLLTLGAEAFLDLKKGIVVLWWMLPAVCCGLLCNTGDMRWVWNVSETLCCVAAGCGLSKLTKGSLGSGDVWVLGCLCLNEGMGVMLAVFVSALMMAACYGGGLMLCRHVKRTYKMKFVPFLCAAYVVVLFLKAV